VAESSPDRYQPSNVTWALIEDVIGRAKKIEKREKQVSESDRDDHGRREPLIRPSLSEGRMRGAPTRDDARHIVNRTPTMALRDGEM
jgi:hypothetical protein